MNRSVTAALALWIFGSAPVVLAATGERTAGDAEARVERAALGLYIHGMTAAIAEQEVGRDGIPALLRFLEDPAFPRRDNVVAFLAYLGGPESTAALVRLLERRTPPDASIEDRRALLLVPHALGHIAARGDKTALDALLAMTADPARRAAARAGLAIARGTAPPPLDPAATESAVVTPAYTPDPARQTHTHGLTFVNHVNTTSPMTAARLDSVLHESSLRVATGDFDGDVPCCTVVQRSGSGGTFGTPGDGLDTVNDAATINAVLAQNGGRVKIVNVINYCGGAGTNIIGCSYAPGNGMVVVRLSSLPFEAVLWPHEYGHNLGLQHSTDARAIMNARDNGANNGLAPAECAAFHSPAPSALAIISATGTCTDDGDALADPIDNCPFVANQDQADLNNNGIGDACETGAPIGDIDLSGRVDGFDLSRLGRAFGAAAGNPRYDLAADINRDGKIDGDDLALLAANFGK